MRRRIALLLAACAVLFAPLPVRAQLGAVNAELTPLVERDGVHAGTAVRTALRIRLPEGFHMNSDRPRDPLFVRVKFQAENPDETPAKEVMQRFGAVGLPTYAIVRPRPEGRSEP